MTEEQELPKTEAEEIPSSPTVAPEPETPERVNPLKERLVAGRSWVTGVIRGIAPRWRAYQEQWPRTFLTWFLALLALSLLVWRFAPGDAAISTYTPAQGLLIPISVFGGPAILAAFIASHSGLQWYSDNVGVKRIGLALIDYFFKFRAWIRRTIGLERSPVQISSHGIMDLPFPGLGYQAFQEQQTAQNESVSSEQLVEAVARYQLDNMGSIAVNFLTVYLLIKLPTVILWEAISLFLEWGVYKLGFSIARIPFPTLTLYHWELFVIENLAVAIVIFFQEIKIDTSRTNLALQRPKMKEVSSPEFGG
jgi:hypothetical protein